MAATLEYIGLGGINGSLVAVKNVRDMSYEEIV